MRTTFLVCYDIADDKRLRKVFKTCCNFGDHLQFSVFECDLSPSEKRAHGRNVTGCVFCRTWNSCLRREGLAVREYAGRRLSARAPHPTPRSRVADPAPPMWGPIQG